MAKVSCRYFVNVRSATNKDGEVVEVPDGLTVEQFLWQFSKRFSCIFRGKAATSPNEAGRDSDGKAATFRPVVGTVAGFARKIPE